jgi:hypothetical protein
MRSAAPSELPRSLGLLDALAIVIAIVIGGGIVAFTNKRKISWLDDGVLRSRSGSLRLLPRSEASPKAATVDL